MENREFLKKPSHVFLLAMLCCILWGSAAPFIKWGYQLFNIEGVPSILMFAGIRFALAGLLVILFGSFLQKKVLVAKKENMQGICTLALFQTAGQYFFYYIGLSHTSGVNGSIPTETTICQRLHLAFARCFFYTLFKAYSHIMVIFNIINRSEFILSFR